MSEEEKPDYKELTKQWAAELMENPVVQEYCEPYQKSCLTDFCKAYAGTKAFGLQYGETYRKMNERKQNEWTDAGYQHLCIIQQKKLFDAQCLWRADQLDIKEIEICYDFHVWESDVLNCPFIEPITEQEVDWYCQYLSQRNVELDQGWMENWQDYDEIKEAYQTDNGNRNVPEWYEFHNGKTGNGTLLILPDIRGERERFYHRSGIDALRKETPPAPHVRDPDFDKPFMSYYKTNLHIDMAKKIEDKKTLSLMKEYVNATEHRHTYEHEQLERDMHYLSQIHDELVSIEAHHDYREAIRRAVESYKCRKIAENLPYAFQKYNSMRELGFAFGTEEDDEKFSTEIGNIYRKFILKGRELNGEPRDFNY